MSVMLPPELSKFLNMIGFEWPEGDEDKIFAWGQQWMSYASEVDSIVAGMQSAHTAITSANQGPGVEAYRARFTESDGVLDVSSNLAIAGNVTGGCLFVIGGAVIVLKVAFVVNLVSFAIQVASAIAAAVPTAGASMSWIPIARLIAQRAIEFAINLAVEKLLAG